jgi:hypothetical protein
MKKLPVTGIILLTTLLMGFGQQENNSSDDVYYQDDNYQQPVNPPADQNYTDDQNNDAGAPTYQTFYDQLSPYGTWVNYPGYGYCWVPANEDPDFSPYMSNGHWVYTDLGWTWVSDFPWGWGPFHYGRWFGDPMYGWIWMPGYDWAPAWVIWGDYDGYYGWACIGPHDVLSPHYRPDARHWHFVDHQYMGREDFGSHVRRADDVAHGVDINARINVIGHANTYGQSVFFKGPEVSEVEKYRGQKVERVQINNVTAPAQTKVTGGQINIYRPNIVRSNVQRATPNKVVNTQDLRPANNRTEPVQRNNNPQPQRETQQQFNNPTPPRQNTTQPRQFNEPSQPQRQYTAPSQPQRQYTAPSQPQRTFVPSPRPAPAPSYSQPRGGSFNGGGGGGFHGGRH